MTNNQQHFIQSLLDGKREITDYEIQTRQKVLGLDSLNAPFVVVDVAPDYATVEIEKKDETIGLFREYLSSLSASFFVIPDSYNNFLILISGTVPKDSYFISLREKLCVKFGMELFIGIGSAVEKLGKINESASDAKEMLGYKYQYADKGVISYSNIVKFQYSTILGTDIVFDRVIGCFLDGDIGKMTQRLDELVEHVRRKPNVSRTSIRRVLVELVIRIINLSSNGGVDVDELLGNRDPYHWIMSQNHTEVITAWIMELSSQIVSQIQESNATDEKKNIKKAKLFIDRNIHDSGLGLQSVSEHLCLTSPYLSQLFKNETGIGINAYITSKRVERAEYLLEKTELKIDDISSQCGFTTAQYFTKVFKDKTGKTPLEYRKS